MTAEDILREPARLTSAADAREELRAAISAAAPKRDAVADVDRLVEAFASPAAALEAGERELRDLGGLPASLALMLSLVPDLARVRQKERSFASGPIVTMRQAAELLRAMYLGESYESCCLLALREDGSPLRVDRVASGTIDETPFYCRVTVEAALASGGAAFVFVHNHPSGTDFASGADVRSTQRLMLALRSLGLVLIDHLILAGRKVVSLRRDALPSAREWLLAAPLPPAFGGWFDKG